MELALLELTTDTDQTVWMNVDSIEAFIVGKRRVVLRTKSGETQALQESWDEIVDRIGKLLNTANNN